MKGYWGNEQQTKESIVDGWMKTGDIGIIDERGYCKIVGRQKVQQKQKNNQLQWRLQLLWMIFTSSNLFLFRVNGITFVDVLAFALKFRQVNY